MAIRMTIAEVRADGSVRTLDTLQKAVSLGRDVFGGGVISQATLRDCVNGLSSFRRVCEEYGIHEPQQLRAIATSSLREAENRDTFLDRIYIATQITVRVIDEAEESRLLFMALQNAVAAAPDIVAGPTVVSDVGGGHTEILLIENGHVTFSNFYRMGTLRMRQALELYRAPTERARTVLGQQIQRVVERVVKNLPATTVNALVCTSPEIQMAAAQLGADWSHTPIVRLPLKTLQPFLEKALSMPVERVVTQMQIPYPEAETIGPALLADVHLARAFKAEAVRVVRVGLRDGLLHDVASRGYWMPTFAREVIYSAGAVAAKYHSDPRHAQHVAHLAMKLFDALRSEHQLTDRHRVLLEVAALLHEIGGYVSSRSHHKHSMYLILNSDLFGLTREDLTLVALTARYHRRAVPKPSHPEYAALSRDDRIAVAKMAALLRVADAFDRNHAQQIKDITIERLSDRLLVTVRGVEDVTLERLALKEKGDLFEQIYGFPVELRENRTSGEVG